jgi:PAS domain S-box-containing protein
MPAEVSRATDARARRQARRMPYEWPAWQQYAVSTALVALSLVGRWLLGSALDTQIPFSLTLGVLLPLVLLVHPGPFLEAAVLAWLGALYLFVPPVMSLALATPQERVLFGVYTGVLALGVVAAWLSRREQDARARHLEQVTHAENTRRESDQRMRLVTDAVPVLISFVDADRRYQFNNRRYEEWFGHSRDAIRGRHMREVLGEAAFERLRPHVEAALGGRAVEFEAEVPYREGGPRYIHANYVPDVRDDGVVAGFYVLVRDITQWRRGEARERELAREVVASEERLRLAKSAAQLGLHDYDVSSGTITWDDRSRELWGIESDEPVTFERWRASLDPRDRASAEQAVRRALDPAGNGHYLDQYRLLNPSDGTSRWIEATGQVSFEAGRAIRLVGTVQDITGRKQAEETIRFHARLLEEVGQAIIVTDTEGVIIYWNRAAEDLYGWSRAEALGRSVLETTPAEGTAVEARDILEHMRAGHSWSGEFEVRRKDGSRRQALVTNTPMLDEEGRLTAIIGISVDISELKRIQQALKDADRRKDEFLATLAHELRNPLAAIRMALGVLGLSGNDPARVGGMTAIIDRQSAQLVRLIDDLLDVSRITRGKVELRKEPVHVAQVLEGAADSMAPECQRKGVRLTTRLPAEPLVIEADALRFGQVMSNLLNNACKFTDRGGEVVVAAERDGDEAVIRVRDTGAGIPRGDLERVFEMFAQVEGPHGRGGGGLGIGLSLARSLVAMHGGSIHARSDGPGQGSEFIVRVPLAGELTPSEAVRTGGDDPAAHRVTGLVLAVDDNRDALEAVAMSLRLAGYTVETAAGGEEAVRKAQALRPRVVLLDIGLPGIDGYEIARRIRCEPWGRDARLVAMTGWGQDKDKQRARDAGFDAHLTKPVDLGELVRVLTDRDDASGDHVTAPTPA